MEPCKSDIETSLEFLISPVAAGPLTTAALILSSLIICCLFSGKIINAATAKSASIKDDRAGWVMGKAENILVVLMCLANELTGVAILISAKAIVRRAPGEENNDNSYRIAGTLVNLAWSLLVGMTARVLIFGLPGE